MSAGTLYVVATPLGHLGDLSPRAREVLGGVHLVAAEDTRRSRKLLTHTGAPGGARLVSVHAHTSETRMRQVVDALREGRSVALVTDAGTPGISDPGAALVRRAREAGIPVVAVPGPSAVVTALSVSGLPADRYTFLGFLPRRGPERRRLLHRIVESEWTIVVFEAANRLAALLEDLRAAGEGAREAAVARELTKLHEECRVGTLDALAGYYRERPPRGEVTVVVAGRREPAAADPESARHRGRALLEEGLSRRDTAARLAGEFGMSRNAAYRLVAAL